MRGRAVIAWALILTGAVADSDKYEGGEESGAAVEKAPEAEEGGEEVELAVSPQEAAPAAAPVVEQEASLAN